MWGKNWWKRYWMGRRFAEPVRVIFEQGIAFSDLIAGPDMDLSDSTASGQANRPTVLRLNDTGEAIAHVGRRLLIPDLLCRAGVHMAGLFVMIFPNNKKSRCCGGCQNDDHR